MGITTQQLFSQLVLGLVNGSFYAILSLGLAIIFGLLNIINFAHGAQYMMGAFVAWMLLNFLGVGYWPALILAPVIVGLFGIILERNLIAQLGAPDRLRSILFLAVTTGVFLVCYLLAGMELPLALAVALLAGGACGAAYAKFGDTDAGAHEPVDHLYGLLLTFGLALILTGVFRNQYGVSGLRYSAPPELTGAQNLGFMILPIYRGWVVVISLVMCLATWFVIEKTKLGAYLRAATENPTLVEAFGINVPRLITLTYGFGVGLAGLAGVLAAPIQQVNPNMGADIIIVVFAVVVIGGMGSILGSIFTGFGLGLVEGLTKVFYPEASTTVIFVVMVLVLLVKPAGLFGRAA